jgi:hypothetical protein
MMCVSVAAINLEVSAATIEDQEQTMPLDAVAR